MQSLWTFPADMPVEPIDGFEITISATWPPPSSTHVYLVETVMTGAAAMRGGANDRLMDTRNWSSTLCNHSCFYRPSCLTLYTKMVTICTTGTSKRLCMLSTTAYLCVSFTITTINSDYFPNINNWLLFVMECSAFSMGAVIAFLKLYLHDLPTLISEFQSCAVKSLCTSQKPIPNA